MKLNEFIARFGKKNNIFGKIRYIKQRGRLVDMLIDLSQPIEYKIGEYLKIKLFEENKSIKTTKWFIHNETSGKSLRVLGYINSDQILNLSKVKIIRKHESIFKLHNFNIEVNIVCDDVGLIPVITLLTNPRTNLFQKLTIAHINGSHYTNWFGKDIETILVARSSTNILHVPSITSVEDIDINNDCVYVIGSKELIKQAKGIYKNVKTLIV
jgi:hypothetical protein